MPIESSDVIPIRRSFAITEADQQIADYAFQLWWSKGLRGDDTPEQCLLAAMLELSRVKPTRLFVVAPKQNNVRPPIPMRRHSAVRPCVIT
jgi:hypothetical protein